ncbi:MAG: ABC transporter ATP-binding protein [Dissulfurispiraceae bacterium]|jgi:putative ABC transport system ATP-binding protein/lipoprotein-releasing system ATP-binding protein
MIEIKDINKSYTIDGKKAVVVDHASFMVGKGEILSIVGHSGSGKTTLLSLIGGLTKPDSGSVVIDGKDIWSMDDDVLSNFRNKTISFIYQFASLIPTLTVLENMVLPLTFGKHGEDAGSYAKQLCEAVGMCDKIQSYPSQLSGGQQRRVAIARAFITNPGIVLADEPTGDLDEENEAEVIRFFKKMNDEKGTIFIIVTHNSDLAKQSGRQLKMSNGVITQV